MPNEQVEENVGQVPVIVNTADDPSVMSATTVAPYPDTVDTVEQGEQQKEEATASETEKPKEEEAKTEEPAAKVAPAKEEIEEEEKVPPGVQKRINKVTLARRTAERERDYERAKRLEAEEELKKMKAQIPAQDEPKIEDYEDETSFLKAYSRWSAKEEIRAVREESSREQQTAEEKSAIAQGYNTIDERMEEGREKYPDFDQVVMNKEVPISDPMVDILAESEDAADVLYYLGKHPDESAEIAALSPVAAAHRLGRIAERLKMPAASVHMENYQRSASHRSPSDHGDQLQRHGEDDPSGVRRTPGGQELSGNDIGERRER